MVGAVHCRQIETADLVRVIPLLTRGFERDREYWVRAVARLQAYPVLPGVPRYGYVLEHDGDLVGVLLLISSTVAEHGQSKIRCNVSSWYVDPSFRLYASVLAQRAMKNKGVTFFNVSPAEHTWKILEAQGFRRFADGQIVAIPILSRPTVTARIQVLGVEFPVQVDAGPDLEQGEIKVLWDHAGFGCLSLICETAEGRYPFVFGLHHRYGVIPVAHLVYCRSLQDFVRLASPIGRYLFRRGYGFVILDCNGPVAGIVGSHKAGRPRYAKGPDGMRIGDVAYSEQVVFGY
jgi:hypothetical protein